MPVLALESLGGKPLHQPWSVFRWSSSRIFKVSAGGALFLALLGCQREAAKPEMTTPYQAVLLSNGSAYFGRLEGLGTPYPVLREVYYVQTRVNQDTKETTNILVKRGKEWHQPDHMILNANMIVLV